MAFHIDKLEKRWVFMVTGIVLMAWGIQIYYAAQGWHPPQQRRGDRFRTVHLETGIGGNEFSEQNIGVKRDDDGMLVVTMVAARYGVYPQELVLPQGEPFKMRVASFDVLHGIYIPMTNLNLMLVPGYVSEVATTVNNLGDYPMLCHDFCGMGHAYMFGNVHIVPADDFKL